MTYDWDDQYKFSEGVVAETCTETIRRMLDGCVSIDRASTNDDLSGIDYIATLRRGAKVFIDHKARNEPCSKYWSTDRHTGKKVPELALELWSIMPSGHFTGKAGWTLDESKKTHYTLHTFNRDDTEACYLIPFQLLRVAFRKNKSKWTDMYRSPRQNSFDRATGRRWQSQCVFVPVNEVMAALQEQMIGVAACTSDCDF